MKLSDLKDGMVTLDAVGDLHLVMYGKWMIGEHNGRMDFSVFNEDMEAPHHIRDIVAVWDRIEMSTDLKCHIYNHPPIWVRDKEVLEALRHFPCPCNICIGNDYCGLYEEEEYDGPYLF